MPVRSVDDVLEMLHALASPVNVQGMARYGINPNGTLGISVKALSEIARELGRDHPLALALWDSGIHEARILAAMVDDPTLVTESQMDAWAADFDSWDVVDQCCNRLFCRTSLVQRKALEWSNRPEEFVKRAAFVLMTQLAVHDRREPDRVFEEFLQIVEREAADPRNYVRKAVNWALREIGKRRPALYPASVSLAEKLSSSEAPSARWIGRDALRELTAPATVARIEERSKKARRIRP